MESEESIAQRHEQQVDESFLLLRRVELLPGVFAFRTAGARDAQRKRNASDALLWDSCGFTHDHCSVMTALYLNM